ncbi:RND family efflux transporter MFP subunit [Bradyrhizobium sp. USDA 4503]
MTQLHSQTVSATSGRSRARVLLVNILRVLGVAALILRGLETRRAGEAAVERQSAASAITTVIITHPKSGPALEEVVLPGQVKGEIETSVYARTNGYIRLWKTDIGSHVKAGELLAVIDSPEVDQQLLQAEADLKTAQANADIARRTSDRYAQLVSTLAVSRQAGDDREAAALASAAQVAANEANVNRLRQLQSFEQVVAPFAGVITARNTDVGALINAGGNEGAALFHIAAIDKLRAYVDVPQNYASSIRTGTRANLQFPDRPGKSYPATVTRTSSAIDIQARTLQVELDIDNSSGEFFPGSFVQVHFQLPPVGQGLRLPVNALLFRAEGVQVAEVSRNGKVVLKPITLGRDFGDTIEVLTGVEQSESVVVNPSSAIASGDQVRVAATGESHAGS